MTCGTRVGHATLAGMHTWLARHEPFRALVRRELIDLLRSPWSMRAAAASLGLTTTFMVLNMLSLSSSYQSGDLSRGLFGLYALCVFGTACLIVPPASGLSLIIERERQTLDQLRLAAYSDSAILLSKTLAVVCFYALLQISLLPLAGVIFFFVGVGMTQFLVVSLVSFATAAVLASIGVSCSASCRTRTSSVLMSYLWMLVLLGPPQILLAGILTIGIGAVVLMMLYALVSPAVVVLNAATGINPSWATMFTLPLSLLYLFAAWRISLKRGKKAIQRELPPEPPDESAPLYASNRKADALTVSFGLAPRATWFLLQGVTAMFGALFLAVITFNESVDGMLRWIYCVSIVILLSVPAMVAPYFARHYERDTMNMLRMTLWTAPRLLAGQLLTATVGHICLFLLLLAVNVLGVIALMGTPDGGIKTLLLGDSLLLACFLLAMCAGQFGSLLSRKTFSALVWSYGVTLAAFFAIPAFQGLLPPHYARHVDWLPAPLEPITWHGDVLPQGWYANVLFCLLLSAAFFWASCYVFKRNHMLDR